MLILRRKKDESILIGDNIRITIVECGSEGVRIAIDAPKQISILREELSKAEVVNKDALSPQSEYLHTMQSFLSQRLRHGNEENGQPPASEQSVSSDLETK